MDSYHCIIEQHKTWREHLCVCVCVCVCVQHMDLDFKSNITFIAVGILQLYRHSWINVQQQYQVVELQLG